MVIIQSIKTMKATVRGVLVKLARSLLFGLILITGINATTIEVITLPVTTGNSPGSGTPEPNSAGNANGQTIGSLYTIWSVSAFTTGRATMAGMLVTAQFLDGSTATCVWAAASGCLAAASGNAFQLTEVDGANGTFDGTWTLLNLKSSGLTQITLDGKSGFTMFDRGWSAGSTWTTNLGGYWQGTGTANSNVGYDAFGRNNNGSGTTTVTGTVTYTNMIRVQNAAAVGDEFRTLIINFGNTAPLLAGTVGNTLNAVTFRADSDNFTTPEPGTVAMLSFGIVCLVFAKKKFGVLK